MSKWTCHRLEEICSFISDGNWIESKDITKSGIRILTTGNIGEGRFIENAESIRFVSKESIRRLGFYEVNMGDCLLARVGNSIGRICIVPDLNCKAIASVDCTIIKLNHKLVVPKWFLYYTQTSHYRKSIDSIVSTESMRKKLSGKRLKSVFIPLPTLKEQRRIISSLDQIILTIDQLMAITKIRIECIKELYHSFLQNPCDGIETPIGELVKVETGKLLASDATEGGQFPYYTCSKTIQSIDRFAFDSESVILAGNNAKGIFPLWYHKGKFNASQRTYVLTKKDNGKLLCKYLYYQIEKSLDKLRAMSVGADTQFLKIGMIRDLTIPVPSIKEQKRFVAELDRMKCDSEKMIEILSWSIQEHLRLKAKILDDLFMVDSAQFARVMNNESLQNG